MGPAQAALFPSIRPLSVDARARLLPALASSLADGIDLYAQLELAHRDAATFGDTGGWGFGGDSRDNVVADPRAGCFDCHAGRESSAHVVSEWRE